MTAAAEAEVAMAAPPSATPRVDQGGGRAPLSGSRTRAARQRPGATEYSERKRSPAAAAAAARHRRFLGREISKAGEGGARSALPPKAEHSRGGGAHPWGGGAQSRGGDAPSSNGNRESEKVLPPASPDEHPPPCFPAAPVAALFGKRPPPAATGRLLPRFPIALDVPLWQNSAGTDCKVGCTASRSDLLSASQLLSAPPAAARSAAACAGLGARVPAFTPVSLGVEGSPEPFRSPVPPDISGDAKTPGAPLRVRRSRASGGRGGLREAILSGRAAAVAAALRKPAARHLTDGEAEKGETGEKGDTGENGEKTTVEAVAPVEAALPFCCGRKVCVLDGLGRAKNGAGSPGLEVSRASPWDDGPDVNEFLQLPSAPGQSAPLPPLTPLLAAVTCFGWQTPQIVDLLLSAGAAAGAVDGSGRNALDLLLHALARIIRGRPAVGSPPGDGSAVAAAGPAAPAAPVRRVALKTLIDSLAAAAAAEAPALAEPAATTDCWVDDAEEEDAGDTDRAVQGENNDRATMGEDGRSKDGQGQEGWGGGGWDDSGGGGGAAAGRCGEEAPAADSPPSDFAPWPCRRTDVEAFATLAPAAAWDAGKAPFSLLPAAACSSHYPPCAALDGAAARTVQSLLRAGVVVSGRRRRVAGAAATLWRAGLRETAATLVRAAGPRRARRRKLRLMRIRRTCLSSAERLRTPVSVQ